MEKVVDSIHRLRTTTPAGPWWTSHHWWRRSSPKFTLTGGSGHEGSTLMHKKVEGTTRNLTMAGVEWRGDRLRPTSKFKGSGRKELDDTVTLAQRSGFGAQNDLRGECLA
jgi:hypothetical protein